MPPVAMRRAAKARKSPKSSVRPHCRWRVPFASLPPEIIGRVVDKFVMQLEAQLADRNVTIELSQAAREWLGKKGYDKQMGARPLARIIQQEIKKPLADKLLFGDLITGGHVQVDMLDDKPVFNVTPAKAAAKKSDDDSEDDHASGGDAPGGEGPKEPEVVR